MNLCGLEKNNLLWNSTIVQILVISTSFFSEFGLTAEYGLDVNVTQRQTGMPPSDRGICHRLLSPASMYFRRVNNAVLGFARNRLSAQEIFTDPRSLMDSVAERVGLFRAEREISVSMTTTPERINEVPSILRSIDSNFVDRIIISIPEVFEKDPSQQYIIPEELTGDTFNGINLTILRPERDLGPITKLVPALKYYSEANKKSLVITIDDDTIYSKSTFSELVIAAAHNPRAVVGGSGPSLSYWGLALPMGAAQKVKPYTPHAPYSDMKFSTAHVLEGFAGIAYPSEAIPVDLLERYSGLDSFTRVSDDMVISMVLNLSGIPMLKFASQHYSREAPHVKQLPYGFEIDALHRGGASNEDGQAYNARKYRETMNSVLEAFLKDTPLN